MAQISSNVLDMLQAQAQHELSNSLRYYARASWARYRGFEGAGDFFAKEAAGESEHFEKIRAYIEDRNESYIPETYTYEDSSSFNNFEDLFLTALQIERDTTEKLQAIYIEAMRQGDIMTVGFMQDMVNEQKEEERLYQTIIDRFGSRGKDAATDHDLDIWVSERFAK